LCGNADLILQVNKKIDFVRPGGNDTGTNALGSSLVAYGKRGVQALLNAAAAGLGTLFRPCQPVPTSSQLERSSSGPSPESARRAKADGVSPDHADREHYWITPPELLAELRAEFGDFFDPCPFPRPPGFDGLQVPWRKVAYCNPMFRPDESEQSLTVWARKAIREAKLGTTVPFPIPTRSIINMFLESGLDLEMRSWGRVGWLGTITGKPMPSPPPVTLFILRGRATVSAAANANVDIFSQPSEEIAERLVAADREKAGEVWRALLDRLASSMSILFFSGHCIANPR
jgi:hypothetical protein